MYACHGDETQNLTGRDSQTNQIYRWEGFKSLGHPFPDTGYLMWFKGQSDCISSDHEGWWLNTKGSGRHAIFAFDDEAEMRQRHEREMRDEMGPHWAKGMKTPTDEE